MTQPILSREQVLKIVRKTLKENNDRDKLSSDVFVKLYAEFEAAVLERVCGEPVGFVTNVGGYWHMEPTVDWEKIGLSTRLYAINRSKA